MRKILLSVAIGLGALSSSIGRSAGVEVAADVPGAPGCPACDQMSWSYSGQTGPEHWADICGASVCSKGVRQSPIAITGASYRALPRITFHSHSSDRPLPLLESKNYGITSKTSYTSRPDESYIQFAGSSERYRFVELHLHSPSEHTLNGSEFGMEMHVVHVDIRNPQRNVVIGVLIKAGNPNPKFDSILANLPLGQRCRVTSIPYQNVYDLLPADRSHYYTYPGSLTTPDCGETVKWVVLSAEIELSMSQIDQFRNFIRGQGFDRDNRPLQNRLGRELLTNVR